MLLLKRYIIYFLCFIFLAVTIGYLNNSYKYKSAEETLSCIMTQRMDIINKATLGELKQDEAQKLLSDIVDDPLLDMDIAFIKQTNEYPTAIDIVKEMNVLEINDLKIKKNKMTFNAHIVWIIDGILEKYSQENTYSFSLKKHNGTYKLIDYKII